MRPLEQPGLSPGQVPRHVGVGQWAHPDRKPCVWTGWTWLTGWFLEILAIHFLSLNPGYSACDLLSPQILGLTFAMTMYCQVVKADTYCA